MSSKQSPVEAVRKLVDQTTSIVADLLSKKLNDELMVEAYALVKTVEKDIKSLTEVARDRLLSLVLTQGERVTEKGTRKLTIGPWEVEARPRNTGYNPLTIEAMIRAKGKDPANFMATETSFSLGDTTIQTLLATKTLSEQEIEAARYPEVFTLQSPKRRD
jgi:hypothetical protein